MFENLILVIVGLIFLVLSADKFIEGASSLARHYGLSPMLIGMIIVGYGTSAPEMLVSGIAAIEGNPTLAFGNALGSNIANIALILGISALIKPIAIHSGIVKKEIPILTAFMLFAMALTIDLEVSRFDSILLLVGFFGFCGWSIYFGLKAGRDSLSKEFESEIKKEKKSTSLIKLILGLLILLGSSKALVQGSVGLAQAFGVSDMIIGLTIVAIGTSLPELASSIIAAKKGESEIALGNVLGSNIFNLLAVIGISGSILPFSIEKADYLRDFPVSIYLTLSLFLFGLINKISRLGGMVYILSYVGYLVYLAQSV